MASSQVERVASSSPFACVLRDRNRPDRCNREANNANSSRAATIQKNLKVLVRDHLHNCISVSPDENSLSQQNSDNLDSVTIPSNSRNSPSKNEIGNNNSSSCSSTRMNSRQARNLDRWAAKQAEQMVSTIERQNQEAELWVVASSNPCSSSNSKEPENRVISSQNSIAESECSSKSQIGASSLVQIWEARLNQPKSNPQMSQHSRTSSVSSLDNINLIEEPSRHSDVFDSVSNNDLLTDWDSTAQSTTSTINRRHSDVGLDKEKVRIADIIRRLTCDVHDHHDPGNGNNCDTPRRTSTSSEPSFEHRGGWPLIVNSPRIRGRQAFHDLLLHIEHDRHKELGSLAERQAVSKFCYRGRIQSLLKLRFLRRDVGVQTRPVPVPPTCKPPQHSSSIMQLRERLKAFLEQEKSGGKEAIAPKKSPRPEKHCRQIDNFSTQHQSISEGKSQERAPHTDLMSTFVSVEHLEKQEKKSGECLEHSELPVEESIFQESKPLLENQDTEHEAILVTSNQVEEKRNKIEGQLKEEENKFSLEKKELKRHNELDNIPILENIAIHSSIEAWQERNLECEMELESMKNKSIQQTEDLHHTPIQKDITVQSSVEAWKERNLEFAMEDDQEVEASDDEEEEYFEEAPYDWFSDIAKPRSYWEDMRRSWYDEMLSSGCGNRDIKELLERKTVSSFLSSEFRERIDRLMLSRAHIQANQEQQRSEADENQEKMAQLALSYFHREANEEDDDVFQEKQSDRVEKPEEQEEVDEETEDEESEDEEEEEEEYLDQEEHQQESLTSRQFVEANDLFDQSSQSIFSPSPFRSWNYGERQDMEEYDRFSNAASQLHNQPFRSSQDRRRCSCSTSHALIEVDVVNELRGNMEQIRSEMTDLRKLMQSCMEMQMNFMRLVKHEIQPDEVGTGINSTNFQQE
ncbi:unnamed protein product [Linum tenue]|uniref:Uncharacterized protein n=1 Tax=Linum tenue TaxID=586396 RepID=A0AAV0I8H2_9ROSI|nr:unnamed protein product [Linum tenue]